MEGRDERGSVGRGSWYVSCMIMPFPSIPRPMLFWLALAVGVALVRSENPIVGQDNHEVSRRCARASRLRPLPARNG